jgi:CTD small phosphatase-like protein 2
MFSPAFPQRPGEKGTTIHQQHSASERGYQAAGGKKKRRDPHKIDEDEAAAPECNDNYHHSYQQCSFFSHSQHTTMDVDGEVTTWDSHSHLSLFAEIEDLEMEIYEEDDFDPYLFIASLPPRISTPVRSKYCLPPKAPNAPRISLVLDLDETLVHCSTDPDDIINPDFAFQVEFNGQIYNVKAKKRPGFDEFMRFIKGRFEITVFTASQKVYADKLLDILDPNHEYIEHRVFRDDCCVVEGNYLKDLTVLGRDLSTTVIVDNSPQAFSYQLSNGIPILTWFDCERDRELLKLIPLLDKLATVPDPRVALTHKYKLHEIVDQKRMQLRAMGHLDSLAELSDWQNPATS